LEEEVEDSYTEEEAAGTDSVEDMEGEEKLLTE